MLSPSIKELSLERNGIIMECFTSPECSSCWLGEKADWFESYLSYPSLGFQWFPMPLKLGGKAVEGIILVVLVAYLVSLRKSLQLRALRPSEQFLYRDSPDLTYLARQEKAYGPIKSING